jgi:hypothetical protein
MGYAEDNGGKKCENKSRAEMSELDGHTAAVPDDVLAENRELRTENLFMVSSR